MGLHIHLLGLSQIFRSILLDLLQWQRENENQETEARYKEAGNNGKKREIHETKNERERLQERLGKNNWGLRLGERRISLDPSPSYTLTKSFEFLQHRVPSI